MPELVMWFALPTGMGEQELDTEQDFSRVGRVNAMLARRLQLLAQVDKMARQFGVVSHRKPCQMCVALQCEVLPGFFLGWCGESW